MHVFLNDISKICASQTLHSQQVGNTKNYTCKYLTQVMQLTLKSMLSRPWCGQIKIAGIAKKATSWPHNGAHIWTSELHILSIIIAPTQGARQHRDCWFSAISTVQFTIQHQWSTSSTVFLGCSSRLTQTTTWWHNRLLRKVKGVVPLRSVGDVLISLSRPLSP